MAAVACAHCGGLDLELDGSEEEVVLESITVERMPENA
jgi:hypothetical protein